jgi:hypothetical protein
MLEIQAGMDVGLHVKCLLFLYDFNPNWNVPTGFSKTYHYQIHENLLGVL